jgi:hypothetical protein
MSLEKCLKVQDGRSSVGARPSGQYKIARGSSHQTFQNIVIYLEELPV